MDLYNNTLTERLVASSCIKPFVNDKGLVCRCGQCYACKQIDRLNWSFRLNEETNSDYVFAKFGCTLTYDNRHLPILNTKTHKVKRLNQPDGYDLNCLPSYKLPVLFTQDRQNFIKALRNRIDYRFENVFVRFFCSAEYGGANDRPHFHFALWFCKIDPKKPVLFVLKRDQRKNILASVKIDPAMSEVSFAAVVKKWIQGSEHYFVDGESDRHPINPSSRCEHIKPDLWPFAEARLKYNPKYDRLMWSCVSIEVLGENYGAYLGGYLAKSDHKILYPGSVHSPEKKSMSKGNTFTLENGEKRFFGCIGFQFCERNKDTYLSQLHESQRTFKACHMLREVKIKDNESKLVLLPRAFVRYYYRLYDDFSENVYNRFTKVFRSLYERDGLSMSLLDTYNVLTEKRKNERMFDKSFVPYRFTGSEQCEKYLFKDVHIFTSLKDRVFAFYKWLHSPRRLQSLYYADEVCSADRVVGSEIRKIGTYLNGNVTITDNSDYSSYILDLFENKKVKYCKLAKRTLSAVELKANKRLQYVRNKYEPGSIARSVYNCSSRVSVADRFGFKRYVQFVKRAKYLLECPFGQKYNYQIPF